VARSAIEETANATRASRRRNQMTANIQSYTAMIEVAGPPHHVFECILDVSKWWAGKEERARE
jgi:hypothetical protein